MNENVLDNLVWHALTGPQSEFSHGSGLARRYRRGVGTFCAVEHLDADGWSALGELVGPGRAAVLFQRRIGPVPDDFAEIARFPTLQMVADGAVEPTLLPNGDAVEVVRLGADDADDMVALTALTEPGPFFPETYQLGTYIGIREDGHLIAMAGERLRTDEVSEISAVCTHPTARRRGLAALLTQVMVDEIRGRGQTPLLHVARTNTGAIAVYEQLGFRVRCEVEGFAARFVAGT